MKAMSPSSGGKCSCPLCKSQDEHYQAEDDARHLADSGEVRGDPKRHKAALAHLQKKADDTKQTADMEAKVKKGLAGVFSGKEAD